jgi:hypothetical protein
MARLGRNGGIATAVLAHSLQRVERCCDVGQLSYMGEWFYVEKGC